MDPKFIRNFCIIAHIDHGKSTLADRLLEMTGALSEREMHEQVLDSMDLERERGITIKAKSIRLHYKAKDGNTYRLNLIDTPGHVDFSYEVSRALSACEGALLVVDASQGVEAQTVANTFLAAGHNLTIIPVINKIDLPAAQPDFAKEQIESVLAIPAEDALLISAKSGLGVDEVLEAIVARIPPPKGSAENPLQALIFDSWFDIYRGAVVLVRVMEGRVSNHLKIVQERLEREFGLNLITTAPSVRYRITRVTGEVIEVDSPSKFPNPSDIEKIEEPLITAMIITNEDSIGGILQLCQEKRGAQKKFEYLSPTRVMLTYELPLNEIVLDFYDRLKSTSRGYASLDYHLAGYSESDLIKLDVLVAGEPVAALALIIHRDFAAERGRELVTRLRKLIPRQMFEVPIQAAIGSRVIARETVAAIRKNVLAKCYGGDISRKRKLLEKQKEGKRRMKRVGQVDIPQEAFLAVLKVSSSDEESPSISCRSYFILFHFGSHCAHFSINLVGLAGIDHLCSSFLLTSVDKRPRWSWMATESPRATWAASRRRLPEASVAMA